MGARLVAEALTAAALEYRMTPGSRLVLLTMATHALDTPGKNPANPPRVYWGGHRLLAMECFGTIEWSDNAPGKRRVKRAISDLIDRKLIRVYDEVPGHRTAYELLPKVGT